MADVLDFLLQGTDGLSPVVDQGAASVGRLDAAGQRAFTRLVESTLRYQTTMERLRATMEIVEGQQERFAAAGNFSKAESASIRLLRIDEQMENAYNKLTTAQNQWSIAAAESAQRIAGVSGNAAAQTAERWRKAIMDQDKWRTAATVAAAAEEAKKAAAAEKAAAQAAAAAEKAAARESAAFQRAAFERDRLLTDVRIAAEHEAAKEAEAAEKAAAREIAAAEKAAKAARQAMAAANGGSGPPAVGSQFSDMVSGMIQGAGQRLTGFLLDSVTGAFHAVGQAAGEAFGFITQATADQQSALVTYARELGSVAKAYQEMAAVKGGAVLSSRELPEVLDLDQKLIARFKTMEAVEAASGRAFKQVRTDILDTGAALRLSSEQINRVAIDLQELGGPSGGRALQSLNMIVGITRDDLMKLGIEFDKTGHMLSGPDKALRAVLTTLEQRFQGMDALQSRTFNGMTSNVADLARMFASELGEKGIGAATAYISRWIEGIVNNPNLVPTLEKWGDRIGRITEAGFRLLERMGEGAQRLYQLLKPTVDLFGTWADSLPAASDGMADLMQRAASTGEAAQGGFEAAATGAQSLAATQATLERQQKGMSRMVEDTRTAYDRLIGVQRAQATAVKRDEEDIRYATDQANQPLKDKITLLDRIYEQTHKETDLAKLNREIARDQALSKDQFSSEGRAAGLRLIGEEQQRADLLAAMSHDKEKNRLQDGISANERARDVSLHGKQMEQRGIEDTIAKLEAQHKAADLAYRAEQRRIEDQLAVLKEMTAIQDSISAVYTNVTGAVRAFGGTLGPVAGTVATVGTKADGTSRQLSIMETRLQTLGNAGREAARSIGLAFSEMALTVGYEAAKVGRGLDAMITGAEASALQMRDFFSGQDQSQDAELQARLQHLTALQQEDQQAPGQYRQALSQLVQQYANNGQGTAPTGRVGIGGPVVESGGRDFGPDFGPGIVAPPTPAPPLAHSTHVEIVMQEDADGKWHKVRQVVKDELGNPQNSDALGRSLAPLLARSR